MDSVEYEKALKCGINETCIGRRNGRKRRWNNRTSE